MFKALLCALALLTLGAFAGEAQAQNKAQQEATEAFRACRELEQQGDATACWQRWLDQHRSAGNEAEILVAEERLSKADSEKPATSNEAAPQEEAAPNDDGEASDDNVSSASSGVTQGPDLCANAPDGRGKKERVTVFGIAGSSALDQNAELNKAQAAKHLNEAFLRHFPSARFHNLTTTLTGDASWASSESLALSDVKAHIGSKAGSDAGKLEQAVGCSEYLAFPTMTTFSAKPADGGALRIELTARLGVFRVKGDRAELMKTLDAKVPSASDLAEDEDAKGGSAGASASLDGADGSLKAHERASSVCQKAAAGGDKTLSLSCELRVRGYMLANTLKEAAKALPGWSLSAPLTVNGSTYGTPLGKADGVRVGDGFVALNDQGQRVAYFKATHVGPGGAGGDTSPSTLALRLGSAPANALISEHEMLGLGLQLHGAAAMTIGAQEHRFSRLVAIGTDRFALVFKTPTVMFGGGGALSYDISGLISWPESSVRLGADYLVGQGRSTQAAQLESELLFEKGFYLGKMFELYAGLGGSFSFIQLRSVPHYGRVPLEGGVEIAGQQVNMQGLRFGGALLVGLEFLLTPNIGIRLEGNGRLYIPQQGYDSPNPATSECPIDPSDPNSPIATDPSMFPDSRICWGFAQRNDSWNAAGGRLGAVVLF